MPTKYSNQRAKVVPPHVSLRVLRTVSGLTLDQVCHRVNAFVETVTGDPGKVRPGTISGLELGHRGASLQLLAALEHAYGLNPGDIATDYLPRQRDLEAV